MPDSTNRRQVKLSGTSTPGLFDVSTELSGTDTFVVSLPGDHDLATAPEIDKALHEALSSRRATVVVDLSETTFLDSAVLDLLLRTRTRLADGRQLVLVCDDPTIQRVLEIAGVDQLFNLQPSRPGVDERI